MRSFRKAKIKKKKEAMLQESLVIDELGSQNTINERPNDMRRSRLTIHEAERQNKSNTKRLSISTTSHKEDEDLEEQNKNYSNEETSRSNNNTSRLFDESMPVFKGA